MTGKIALALLIMLLIGSSLALTDYQRGVLDGLNRGWHMGQKYDQAQTGDVSAYNQAVPQFNEWIRSIFGNNESLMLKNMSASESAPASTPVKVQPFTISKTFGPIHEMDASFNQSYDLMPQPDASGRIHGYDAETYYTWGPGLDYI